MIPGLRFKLIVWFSRLHGIALRTSGGRLMRKLMGLNMLLLSTTGRRTGQLRNTPLLYLEHNGRYYCVASFAGNDSDPSWFLNLLADPNVELLVNRERFTAKASQTSGLERTEVWEKFVEYYPGYANYQQRTDRIIPVVRFDPVSSIEKSKTQPRSD